MITSPLVPTCGDAGGLHLVVQKTGERTSQSTRIGGPDKYAALSVFDDLGNAAGARGDDGSVREHSLYQDTAERLGRYGSVHHDVGKAHEVGNVLAEAEEVDPIHQIHRRGTPSELFCISILPEQSGTDEHRVDARKRCERVNKNMLTLPPCKAAKGPDDRMPPEA